MLKHLHCFRAPYKKSFAQESRLIKQQFEIKATDPDVADYGKMKAAEQSPNLFLSGVLNMPFLQGKKGQERWNLVNDYILGTEFTRKALSAVQHKGDTEKAKWPGPGESGYEEKITALTKDKEPEAAKTAKDAYDTESFKKRAEAIAATGTACDDIYRIRDALVAEVNKIFAAGKAAIEKIEEEAKRELEGLYIAPEDALGLDAQIQKAGALMEHRVFLEEGDTDKIARGIVVALIESNDLAKNFVDGLSVDPRRTKNMKDVKLQILRCMGIKIDGKDQKAARRSPAGELIDEINSDPQLKPAEKARLLGDLALAQVNMASATNALARERAIAAACAPIRAHYARLKTNIARKDLPFASLREQDDDDPESAIKKGAIFLIACDEFVSQERLGELFGKYQTLVSSCKIPHSPLFEDRIDALRRASFDETEYLELEGILAQQIQNPLPASAEAPESTPLIAPSAAELPVTSAMTLINAAIVTPLNVNSETNVNTPKVKQHIPLGQRDNAQALLANYQEQSITSPTPIPDAVQQYAKDIQEGKVPYIAGQRPDKRGLYEVEFSGRDYLVQLRQLSDGNGNLLPTDIRYYEKKTG